MDKTYYIAIFNKLLENTASREELQELFSWLRMEGSFNEWADETWETVCDELSADQQEKIWKAISGTTGLKKQVLSSRRIPLHSFIRVAAVVLLLVASTLTTYFITLQQMPAPADMTASVEKGQKANLVLPDGTLVWINSASTLTYGAEFNRKERNIYLSGEAYFEVASDAERPFTVHAGDISVTALGTSFNVKSYADENQVTAILLSGKVQVKYRDESVILMPDESVTIDKYTRLLAKKRLEKASDYIQWRDNTLHFNKEPLENIAKTLERYYNTTIVFESEELKQYRFTGSPGNTSLETILHLFSLTAPVSYEMKEDTILLRENTQRKSYFEKAMK